MRVRRIQKETIKPTWSELLERRRCRYFPDAPVVEATAAALLFKNGFGKYNCASGIKTLVGGWHSSRRMHEDPVQLCLLGCGGQDSLDHYSSCERWRALFAERPELEPLEGESLFDAGSVVGLARCARGHHMLV